MSFRMLSNVFLNLILGLLIFIAGTGLVEAQDDVQEMDEVQVRAPSMETLLASELARFGSQVDVVTGEEMKKAGHDDLQEALDNVAPGFFVRPESGGGSKSEFSLRGSGTGEVLFLIDGVRLNSRLFAGAIPPLDALSIHLIDRIEIVKGGQGIFYGSKAIAGVVNIVLKSPKSTREGEVGIGFEPRFAGRNSHGFVTDAVDGHKFIVWGTSEEADGFKQFDQVDPDDGLNRDRSFDRTNLGFKYEKELGPEEVLRFYFQRNDFFFDNPDPERFRNINERDENISYLKYDKRLDEQNQFFAKAYFHDRFTSVVTSDSDGSRPNDGEEGGFEEWGINTMLQHTREDGDVFVGGVDFKSFEGKDFVLSVPRKTEDIIAGFVQYRPKDWISDQTNLSFGARYDLPENAEESVVWDATIRHEATSRMTFRGKIGTSFRLPSLVELFNDDEFFLGNPNLEPQDSIGGELGVDGRFRWNEMPVTVRVTGFYREVDNLIQLDSTSQFENADGEVEVEGVEASLALQYDREWELDLSGAYASAEEDGVGEQLDDRPEFFAKARLQYDDESGRWGSNLSANYTGSLFNTRAGRRKDIGEYTVFDLAGYFNVDPEKRHQLRFRWQNVLDEDFGTGLDSFEDNNTGNEVLVEDRGAPSNVTIQYTYSF